MRSLLASLALITSLPAVATTQLSDRNQSAPRSGCLRGLPLASCTSFWITEAGVGARFASRSVGEHSSLAGMWEFGAMRNLNARTAAGVTAYVHAVEGAPEAGIRLRRRWWLSDFESIDAGPGMTLGSAGPTGFTAMFAVTTRSRSLTINYSDIPDPSGTSGRRRTTYVGIRFGHAPGAVMLGASAMLAMAQYTALLVERRHRPMPVCDVACTIID